jgi:hypothetical protein
LVRPDFSYRSFGIIAELIKEISTLLKPADKVYIIMVERADGLMGVGKLLLRL